MEVIQIAKEDVNIRSTCHGLVMLKEMECHRLLVEVDRPAGMVSIKTPTLLFVSHGVCKANRVVQ